ncbi:uncharacterized protein [Oryctolagus cuniculus]|uniref:uncharacterized protein isoform X1 n=1 Tax=Oryctolagus cuniculus TaxID=9986 RepID=UPI00387A00BB
MTSSCHSNCHSLELKGSNLSAVVTCIWSYPERSKMGNLNCCPAGSCLKCFRRKGSRRSRTSTAHSIQKVRKIGVLPKNTIPPTMESVEAAPEHLVEEIRRDGADEEATSLGQVDSRSSENLPLEDAWEELPGDTKDKETPEYTEVISIRTASDWVLQSISDSNSEDEASSEGYKGASELSLGSSDLGLSTCSLDVNYSQSLQDMEELDKEAQELDDNKMEPRSGETAIELDLESGDEWIFRIHTDIFSSLDDFGVEYWDAEELEFPKPSET